MERPGGDTDAATQLMSIVISNTNNGKYKSALSGSHISQGDCFALCEIVPFVMGLPINK